MVLGAAGGVGLAAVQIGKACGAIVIAVARYSFPLPCLYAYWHYALSRVQFGFACRLLAKINLWIFSYKKVFFA